MSKDNKFLKGAAILGAAGILIKILGAIYRIPITNIITSEGMGYYQTAYPLYTLLLALSTSGVPVAISKLVSEKRALGDPRGAYKVFKVALVGLFIGGILTSVVVAVGAKSIVEMMGNPNAYYALIALAPATFFVPIMSAFRGFFQGRQSMVPTAVSQTVEQIFRVFTGLALATILLGRGIPIAAGGASFGGSAGAIAGTLIIVIMYFMQRNSIKEEISLGTVKREYSTSRIVKDLLTIAIPITFGAMIAPIMDTIDTPLVLYRLQGIGYTEAQANDLYGQLKGMAQTLINFPQVFSVAIAMSMVSAVSTAYATKNREEIKSLISSGIRITLLIGFPAALGLFVLSTPIINLLYAKSTPEVIASTGRILSVLSFSVIFLTLVQTLTAMHQGIGKTLIPVRNLAIGAAAKLVLSYILIAIPSININGAAISTVAAYAIAAILNLKDLIKVTKVRLNYRNIIFKPFISSVGMAIAARLVYNVIDTPLGGKWATLFGVGAGVLVYAVLLVITGTLTREDYMLIPKGEKIATKMEKFKKLK